MSATCRPRTARCCPTMISRCRWEVDTASKKRLADIGNALKDADELILATDPDREGEAISWHVLDVLTQKKLIKDKPVSRVVFNAITKSAITEAMLHPRADRRRRWSTPIWRAARSTISSASRSRRSSGASCRARARPAACSRWRSDRLRSRSRDRKVQAGRILVGRRQADRKGQELRGAPLFGRWQSHRQARHRDRRRSAQTLKAAIEAGSVRGSARSKRSRPSAIPMRRSPLRACSRTRPRGWAFRPSRTMQIAQRLYEDGIITYMRTDGIADGARSHRRGAQRHREGIRHGLPAADAARSTRPRPRTPRKRTRPSGRPTCSAIRISSRRCRTRKSSTG